MWTEGVQGFDTLPYWERETEHEIQHQKSGWKDTVCQVKDGAMCSRLRETDGFPCKFLNLLKWQSIVDDYIILLLIPFFNELK